MSRTLLLAVLVLSHGAYADAPSRPNVVLVMTDDQGYGDFGFTGNTVVRTPHLDAMAARSAWLRHFYVSPVCAPTRASLMTGRYNYRTRAIDTYVGRAMMEPEEVTVAEALRDAGYATGIFGKWHLGDNYPMRATDQGFEEALVHRGGGIGQPSDPLGAEDKYTDPILFHNNREVQMEGYCTDLYFDATFDFMAEHAAEDEPFFAYISTNAPHSPFDDVPEDLRRAYMDADLDSILPEGLSDARLERERDKLARILAMETNIDDNMGRLFEKLRELEIEENTVVFFLTDNGPNGARYVEPFRGQKANALEGGIRTVFLAHWPGQFHGGHRSYEIAAHIDVMPTILDICGVDKPRGVRFDGKSVLPLLRGDEVPWPRRYLFLQWHRGDEAEPYRNFAVRAPQWKLVRSNPSPTDRRDDFELYRIMADPGETRNVAEEHPRVYNRLLRAYDRWFEDVSTTRPDNYAPPRMVIGSAHQPVVCLTRQDWRNVGPDGWGSRTLGYWLVDVLREGAYSIRLVFSPNTVQDRAIRVRCAGFEHEGTIPAGADSYTIEEVYLGAGETKFEAEIEDAEGTVGVHQAFVSMVY